MTSNNPRMVMEMRNTPLTTTQTRALLDELGHRPRKNLGQNFLIDGNIVRKSLTLGNVSPGDPIIEIGPGLGSLSQALLEAGATVHAIEYDTVLSDYLQRTLQPAYPDNFFLIQGNAVHNPLAGYTPDPATPYKIIANLPYAITSHWLDHVIQGHLPKQMVLMMQEKAARRITAQPGSKNFSPISIFTAGTFKRISIDSVSKNCFYPVPNVNSVLLKLELKEDPIRFPRNLVKTIRLIFTQRRKQMGNHLKQFPQIREWMGPIEKAGIKQESRPEEIPLHSWYEIARLTKEKDKSRNHD